MENKLLKNPVYNNKDGFNSHNLSQRTSFSSSVGQLLPIYRAWMNPGDKITINDHMETRTLTLDSAVWSQLTDTIDWFFVPMDQIYSQFGSMFYGIDDRKTSLIDNYNNISQLLPAFSMGVLASNFSSLGTNDVMGYPIKLGFLRLLDCFGTSAEGFMRVVFSMDGEQMQQNEYIHPLSLIWFAAYQKIYYDFYRLDEWQANDPLAYNLDRFYNRRSLIDTYDSNLWRIFQMRYRPFGKDFYKNIFPTPLIPAGSSPAAAGQSLINSSYMGAVNQWLSGQKDFVSVSQGISTGASNTSGANSVSLAKNTSSVSINALTGGINTANLRSMFALDKLLEVTRRAGKSYDLQTLAHYGVKVEDFNHDKVRYLGTHESPIIMNAVISNADTATADGSGALVGDISGKGFGSTQSKKPIRFEAPCHGILMGIYSCVPVADYKQNGIDKLDTIIERVDLPIQEFQNLGMQPLFNYQVSTFDNVGDDVTDWSDFSAWQYRYSEYKMKINRVFGSLSFSERRWKPQIDFTFNDYNSLSNRLIRPTWLNGIVAVNFSLQNPDVSGATSDDPNKPQIQILSESFISQMYDKDPLLHNFVFDVALASKLSNYGLPSL